MAVDDRAGGIGMSADAVRSLRRGIEEAILPLATSVDGRGFSFQASLHGLELELGSYVVLEHGDERRLGQVVTLELARGEGPDVAPGGDPETAALRMPVKVRYAAGEGRLLDGPAAPFHDATLRPATPAEVRAHVAGFPARRAALGIGDWVEAQHRGLETRIELREAQAEPCAGTADGDAPRERGEALGGARVGIRPQFRQTYEVGVRVEHDDAEPGLQQQAL
jgi:hypothetical protein